MEGSVNQCAEEEMNSVWIVVVERETPVIYSVRRGNLESLDPVRLLN